MLSRSRHEFIKTETDELAGSLSGVVFGVPGDRMQNLDRPEKKRLPPAADRHGQNDPRTAG